MNTQNAKKVLKTANGYELKAGHNYLIVFDQTQITKEDGVELLDYLGENGIKGIGVGVRGSTDNVIEVLDVTEAKG